MSPRLKAKLLESRPPYVTAGRFTYGDPRVITFPSGALLTVGSFCSIADDVTILLGGNHDPAAATTYPLNALWDEDGLPMHEATRGDVAIGNDVWIGYGVLILSGVTIGDGAIIGARAVVSRDVEPFSVVAGNPADHLRFRFPAHVRQALEEIRWWDWPEELIRRHASALMGNASAFCEMALREGVTV